MATCIHAQRALQHGQYELADDAVSLSKFSRRSRGQNTTFPMSLNMPEGGHFFYR
jgi:hypothetical protein